MGSFLLMNELMPVCNFRDILKTDMTVGQRRIFQSWTVHQRAVSTNGNFRCDAHWSTKIMFAYGKSRDDCSPTGVHHSPMGILDERALTSLLYVSLFVGCVLVDAIFFSRSRQNDFFSLPRLRSRQNNFFPPFCPRTSIHRRRFFFPSIRSW